MRKMAERSAWQGPLMTWAAVIAAMASIIGAIFAALAYYRP